jgi:hypothetical protein
MDSLFFSLSFFTVHGRMKGYNMVSLRKSYEPGGAM